MSYKVFFPYFGAKGKLALKLQSMFPDHVNRIYVFGGAGGDIINQEPPAGFEVFNDLNCNIYAAFWCLMNRFDDFVRWSSFRVHSRQYHDECLQMINSNPPDWKVVSKEEWENHLWERGKAWLFIVKHSFHGNLASPAFHKPVLKRGKNSVNEHCYPLSEEKNWNYVYNRFRTSGTTLERQDFELLIDRFDDIDVLSVLDPPYYGEGKAYYVSSKEEGWNNFHVRIADKLKTVKGKFLLNYDDCPFIRELYSDYRIETIDNLSSTMNAVGKKSVLKQELVIMNYPEDDKWIPPSKSSLSNYF